MGTPNLDRVLALAELDEDAAEDALDSLLAELSAEEQSDLLMTVDEQVELLRWVRAHLARATDERADDDDEPLEEFDGAIDFYHVAMVVREVVKHLADAGHANNMIGKALIALAVSLAVEDELPKEAFLEMVEHCFRIATGKARKLDG
jgi:hypothetical protein